MKVFVFCEPFLRANASGAPVRRGWLILFIMLLITGQIQGAVWQVGRNSSEPPIPGASVCTDPQDALSNAQPGDVVQLSAGEWSGNWRLPVGVSLRGSGAALTLLRPADSGQPVITVTGGAASIEGLALRGRLYSSAPLVAGEGGNVVLKRLWISGTGQTNQTPAIWIGKGRVLMVSCSIGGCGVGISLGRQATGEITHSIFEQCPVSISLGSPVFVRHTVFEDVWPGIGNVSMTAGFKDIEAGDLHLVRNSPARLLAPALNSPGKEADGEPCLAARRGAGNWRMDSGADQFVDTDMDGLPSYWEQAHGLMAFDGADAGRDEDHDGLTSLDEYDWGTDPGLADTDNDGLLDGQEVSRGLDPRRSDTDGDNLSDGQEVLTLGSNPFKVDSDGDGLPDGYEAELGLEVSLPATATADTDLDGYTDWAEYVLGSNPVNPLSPPTFYVVPGSEEGGGGEGSEDRPFRGIDYALAQTTGAAVLRLSQGTYQERIRLRPGIRLLGSSPKSVILRGTGDGPVITMEDIGFIRIGGVSIVDGNADEGGGIHAYRTTFRLEDVQIRGCRARRGGGLFLNECTGCVLERVVLDQNRAEQGGGIYARASFGISDGIQFLANRALDGGGFWGSASDLGLRNSVFAENRATRGGGILIQGGCQPLLHLTMVDNRASAIGPAGLALENPVTAVNCIISGHFPPPGGDANLAPGWRFDHLLTENPEQVVGRYIFQGNPGFRNDPLAPYSLAEGSAAIDRGRQTGMLATDWEGNPRTTDGDGDHKAVPDLGADEAVEIDPVYQASKPFQPPAPRQGEPDESKMVVRIQAIRLEKDGVHLQWRAQKGGIYAVEFSRQGMNWELVAPLVQADSDILMDWRDPRWSSPSRMPKTGFYRVQKIPVDEFTGSSTAD